MAILVLGGAGYIGSHMVDRLVEKGQEKVVVVDSLVKVTVLPYIQMLFFIKAIFLIRIL